MKQWALLPALTARSLKALRIIRILAQIGLVERFDFHSLAAMSAGAEDSQTLTAEGTARVEAGALAKMLEEQKWIRDKLLKSPKGKDYLSLWPNELTIGVPSVRSMALNYRILEIIAKWWCAQVPHVQAIPVDIMRNEAWVLQVSTC